MAATPLLSSVSDAGDAATALLAHLDGLFALAQVVTLNAEEAIGLTEETYRRAFAYAAEAALPEDPKTWLYGLLLQVREERQAAAGDAPDASDAAGLPAATRPPDDFRSRLAEQFVHQALPVAFSTLPADLRLLLMLCDVERYDCDAAGALLGLPGDEACARLDRARRDLQAALYDNATEVERHLLATSLPAGWEREALGHLARTELVPVPPTLRPAVRQAHQAPARAAAETTAVVAAGPPEDARPGPPSWGRIFSRFTATLLLILVAGLLGYAFSGLMRTAPETNVLTLSVEQAQVQNLVFETGDAAQAERYVRDRLGWRLVLPGIDGAVLRGVDIREIAKDIEVPVFFYADAASGEVFALYAYTYALLDRHADRLTMDRDILQQIEDDGNYDLYDLDAVRVLVWRNRDDIYVAVTPTAVEDLRERISFPS